MHRPKMVFLDEPTVAIDPQSRRNILDTVKHLNQQGMTVLYTTHYMEEAEELSTRVGIIDHGQIIAMGTIGELVQQVGQTDALIFKVAEIPEGVIAKIKAVPGVEEVDALDSKIEVTAKRGRKLLPELIRLFGELNLTMTSVEIVEPNLETVFLHLTGRALRD
jgi:ABC-2 type transport system ATP-binding protein